MLNKKLCKKCWGDDGWNDADENDWDEYGNVHCKAITFKVASVPDKTFSEVMNIMDEPPEGCRMALEYLVLKQKKEKNNEKNN